jgi:hypothetical protein
MNLDGIYMEFFGAFIIGYCLWIAQALNDSQKTQEQEIEKRVKDEKRAVCQYSHYRKTLTKLKKLWRTLCHSFRGLRLHTWFGYAKL